MNEMIFKASYLSTETGLRYNNITFVANRDEFNMYGVSALYEAVWAVNPCATDITISYDNEQ